MTNQYQHRHFFRKMPNALLAEYFQIKAISIDIGWEDLQETNVDPIFEAFKHLPESQQAQIEADFQNINALACEGGIEALIDEADFHQDKNLPQALAIVDGFHAKAMWAFLNKSDYWLGASMFLHADNIGVRPWKKRNDLPKVSPNVEPEDIAQLASAIGSYFFQAEGRGRNCKVEPYRRRNKEYFFAYPEDYGQLEIEWESNTLRNRPKHPAFEIIFVYCEEEGSLDIYAPGNSKAVPDLQQVFLQSILKLEVLPDKTIDKRVYDLAPLANPNFQFELPIESGIADIVVTKIRLTLKGSQKRKITLEADTKENKLAVYDLLKDLKLPPYFVSHLGLKVVYEKEPGRRTKSRAFTISHPNWCGLNHDGKDAMIRDILSQSGIEPR